MVLIEGRRGERPMMKVEPPIVVYKEQGVYSDEIHEIYGFCCLARKKWQENYICVLHQ